MVDMAYNLGESGLKKFKNLQKAVVADDHDAIIREMISSLWWKQVGRRGPRNVGVILNDWYFSPPN